MSDGINRRAFQAELKSMNPAERRRLMRVFGLWVKEAESAAGRGSYVSILIAVIGLATGILELGIHSAGFLLPLGMLLVGSATLFNIRNVSRARSWRRLHPFEQYRGVLSWKITGLERVDGRSP